MAFEKELREALNRQREEKQFHAPYGGEYGYYEAVAMGEMELLKKKFLLRPIYEGKGLGKLSENEVRSIRYHVIISIAFISRFCIEAGMDLETAYSLSDLYIRKADQCRTKEELSGLHIKMSLDYARRMGILKKEKVYSKHVVLCIEYIQEHIREKILISQLTDLTGLNVSYLSRLFKEEMGITIGNFIRDKKMEEAEYCLKHTDLSVADITSEYNFSSQSYFIQIFKKKNGRTPKEYRDFYFRRNLRNEFRTYNDISEDTF